MQGRGAGAGSHHGTPAIRPRQDMRSGHSSRNDHTGHVAGYRAGGGGVGRSDAGARSPHRRGRDSRRRWRFRSRFSREPEIRTPAPAHARRRLPDVAALPDTGTEGRRGPALPRALSRLRHGVARAVPRRVAAVLAVRGRPVGEIMREHWRRFGRRCRRSPGSSTQKTPVASARSAGK